MISPLLANIALHGLEKHLKTWIKGKIIKNPSGTTISTTNRVKTLSVIRYADDFVIIHKDIGIIKEAKEITTKWLKQVGLEIKENKTKICHSLNKYNDERPGFDFLGFNIRQYPVGKHKANKLAGKGLKPYTLHIKPSKEAIKHHYRLLAETIDKHKSAKQRGLILKLNPILRGWSNYYRYSMCNDTFKKLDYLIFWKLKKWVDRRHPNKPWNTYKKPKYWKTKGGVNWLFSDGTVELLRHKKNYEKNVEQEKQKRMSFTKVQNSRSPFDGDTVYWSSRLGYKKVSHNCSAFTK